MPDLTIRMIKEDFDVLRAHAARAGLPVRKVAREAVREYLERHALATEAVVMQPEAAPMPVPLPTAVQRDVVPSG